MLMEIAHLLTRIQVMHFTVMQYSRIITEDAGIDLSRPPPSLSPSADSCLYAR